MLNDCAELCQATANSRLRESALHRILCRACADACERCAEECGRHSEDQRIARCSATCKKCAASCRLMADMTGCPPASHITYTAGSGPIPSQGQAPGGASNARI